MANLRWTTLAPKKPKNKFIAVTIFLSNIIISHIIPFLLGYYFAISQNILFFIMFIVSILYGLEFDYEKGKVSLTLRRLF